MGGGYSLDLTEDECIFPSREGIKGCVIYIRILYNKKRLSIESLFCVSIN